VDTPRVNGIDGLLEKGHKGLSLFVRGLAGGRRAWSTESARPASSPSASNATAGPS
jgi:hypothetical protein